MKAVVMRETGEPQVLRLEDVPVPSIAPHEVLVRSLAVGVSYHDVVQRNGAMRRDVRLPMVLGYEIAGIVERCGSQVRTLQQGDRICTKAFHACGICRRCRTGMETACSRRQAIHGGYAQWVALPEEACVRHPSSIRPEIACMLGASAGVALHAVRDVGRARVGEHVLVTGASGGVGTAAVEIAALSGCTVIAVTRSEAKVEALHAQGAHHVLVAPEGHDFSAQARSLCADDGVDLVVDTVGSRVFRPAFESLAPGGRYALVGQLFREEIAINPARIFFRRAQLLGVGSVRRDQLEDAVRLTAAGRLHPQVARIMHLEEAAQAHALVEAGSVVGRIVLKVGDE